MRSPVVCELFTRAQALGMVGAAGAAPHQAKSIRYGGLVPMEGVTWASRRMSQG